MVIKTNQTTKISLSYFDLLGSDENALSKAFAYTLAQDKDIYIKFINFLGLGISNSTKNFLSTEILVQKSRDEGITDIELKQLPKYHIILECKVKKGKVKEQRTQYLSAFEHTADVKMLVCLTQERDSTLQIPNDVIVKNTSWLEIIELFNNRTFLHKKHVPEFLSFATKNYKMKEIKEVLVQDLADRNEIERFEKYNLYRRPQTFGSPLYFAPYYSRKSGKTEGISYLSKINGILTFKPSEIDNILPELSSFTSDKNQLDTWLNGIKYKTLKDELLTHYFLNQPIKFPNPLLKDKGKVKGAGVNWISLMIPPNRCVTFEEFIKHIPGFFSKT